MTTPAELRASLDALDPCAPEAGAALEALGDRMKDELDEDAVDEQVLDALWERYGELATLIQGEQLMRAPDPLAAVLAANRPDLVARIGSDAAFAAALEQTAVHVALPYYKTQAGWIHALVTLAASEPRRARVASELGAHLQRMIDARLAGGDLVNAVALAACGRALAQLRPVEAIASLEATLAFCIHPRCHYEAATAGGAIALALAGAAAHASVPAIRAYVEHEDDAHPGARHVMEGRYALWLLTADAPGARAFLDDPAHVKGAAFAAAALADLHATAAIPSLEARLATVTNPITREALAEAMTRLRTQVAPPALADRMIAMFGVRTSSEQALGHATDDVFVRRARAAAGDAELGQVTEADDAGEDD